MLGVTHLHFLYITVIDFVTFVIDLVTFFLQKSKGIKDQKHSDDDDSVDNLLEKKNKELADREKGE